MTRPTAFFAGVTGLLLGLAIGLHLGAAVQTVAISAPHPPEAVGTYRLYTIPGNNVWRLNTQTGQISAYEGAGKWTDLAETRH